MVCLLWKIAASLPVSASGIIMGGGGEALDWTCSIQERIAMWAGRMWRGWVDGTLSEACRVGGCSYWGGAGQ